MGTCGGGYRRREPEATALHRAVREGWPEVERAASERGGLPQRVKDEVRRYLACGVLRYGFAMVKCTACSQLLLVGFSCKGRGLCPSCSARRSEETAAHCEAVLPEVGYRQWTLSLPGQLRLAVVKQPALLRTVERRLCEAVWRWQRACAKRLGAAGVLSGGAVGFLQLFGSALQLTPHLHVLVPEGLWADRDFVALPPPGTEQVVSILRRLVKRLAKDFEGLEDGWAEDALEGLQQQAAQARLPLGQTQREGKARRVALLEGFSLHANTAVHPNDREGLARLCRYGSRGPIALARLSRLDDGRYAYRTKRGPVLILTAQALLQRLLALVPPRGTHLTCFHGVFAPNAALRPHVIRKQAPPQDTPVLRTAPLQPKPKASPRRPRLDWAALQRRTFGVDVWTCACGGKRKVLAVITSSRTAHDVLQNLNLLPPRPPPPRAQAPPQLQLAV